MKKHLINLILLFGLLICTGSGLSAQQITVTGVVTDGTSGEGLPFATVVVEGNTGVGTTTDMNGSYELSFSSEYSVLIADFLGFESQTLTIDKTRTTQVLNFSLGSNDVKLKDVEIIAEKAKYDKSNPAVDLMKEVISRKDANKPGARGYLQHNQYSASSLSLNNITEKSFEDGALKSFPFLKQYIDTLPSGDQILSFYLKEELHRITYRKRKTAPVNELINETKTELDVKFFDQNVEQLLDHLVQKVDVYDNSLFFLDNNFQNPISAGGLNMYRYYLIDSTMTTTDTVIHLWTTPANKIDIGFTGDIYINNEDKAIVKVHYSLDERANLNYISNLKLQQQFEKEEDRWVDKHSTFQALFKLLNSGDGILGKRRIVNTDHRYSKSHTGVYDDIIDTSLDYDKEDDTEFWLKYRAESLGDEQKVLNMIDSLKDNRTFGIWKKASIAVITGYVDFKKFRLGNISSTYTYNAVEGSRLRLGGKTTNKLFPKTMLHGYGVYGLKDERFKYRAGLLRSFNSDFDVNPVHYLEFALGRDQYALGQDLVAAFRNNLATTFTRGENTNFIESRYFHLSYDNEFDKDYRMRFNLKQERQRAVGTLQFSYTDPVDEIIKNRILDLTQIGTKLRWAPNEHYLEIGNKRKPIYSKFPIFEVELEQTFLDYGANSGNAESFTRLELLIFKRLYLGRVGHSDFLIEGGKFWGEGIPYHLLFIPEGNQTYFYSHRLYNLMNFFEFVSDEYVSANYRHFFNGFIMNRLPLIRKLKLRTMITAKALWGNLSEINSPQSNPSAIQFPSSIGQNSFILGDEPYLEGSVALTNIFKLLRVDFVKRFTYLDAPNVPELFGKKGLSIRLKLEASF